MNMYTNIISFLVEVMESNGETITTSYSNSRSIMFQDLDLVNGQTYQVYVRSVLNGSCQGNANMTTFTVPSASSGISSK